MGDFNIDWKSSEDTYSKRLIKCVADMGMIQIVNKYTHILKESRTIIDLVITNDRDQRVVDVLDEPGYMNHRTIELGLEIEDETKIVKKNFRKLIVSKAKAKEKLLKVQWNYNIRDINENFEDIIDKIEEVRNVIMPEREIEIKKNSCWFNDKIKEAIERRKQAHKRFVMTDSLNDWEEYKKRRNETVQLIRKEKQKYYEEKIDENKYNTKNMWKTIKQLTGSKKECDTVAIVKFGEDVYDDSLDIIVEKFNNYFVNSVVEIVGSIRQSNKQVPLINKYDSLTNFKLIEEKELKKMVFSLSNKSSPDGITIAFIKEYWEEIKNPIIHVVNSSIEKCSIPERLKISVVIPLRKVARTICCEEFRPVNTLPAIEKILEKIIYNQLEKYIRENNILSRFQSGFREKHSCETALQCVIGEWKEYRDKRLSIVVVFLDLKRAFETVDRKRLIDKLYACGIRENCLKWFQNYLDNRKQKVRCERKESTLREVKIGVPQGSVLGPLLFAIYLNDLEDYLKHCKYHCFADDTIIYLEGNNVEELINVINSELKDLSEWFAVNKLKLNVNKTKAMCITSENEYRRIMDHQRVITIEGENIEFVEVVKYLGVMVDYKLSFKNHVDYICKKIGKRLGVMYRIKNSLTQYARYMLYNAIILPMFYCCGTILYLSNNCEIDRLQIMQNRGMRMILNCNMYTRVSDMLECLGWMNVRQLLEYQTLIFIYKINTGGMPSYFDKYIIYCKDVHGYDTRRRNNLYIKTANKNMGYNSVFVKGFIKFNELEEDIKNVNNIKIFKIRLKELYQNMYK